MERSYDWAVEKMMGRGVSHEQLPKALHLGYSYSYSKDEQAQAYGPGPSLSDLDGRESSI